MARYARRKSTGGAGFSTVYPRIPKVPRHVDAVQLGDLSCAECVHPPSGESKDAISPFLSAHSPCTTHVMNQSRRVFQRPYAPRVSPHIEASRKCAKWALLRVSSGRRRGTERCRKGAEGATGCVWATLPQPGCELAHPAR